MPQYRLYFLDSGGRIERHEAFEADDDDRAVAAVDPRTGKQLLELWTAGRRVGRFEDALALHSLT